MKTLMRVWKDIIDSLSTRGGTIVLLMLCTAASGAMMIICMVHHIEGDGEITLRNAFVGFSGALLGALANEGKANGKTLQASTSTTETTTLEKKVS